MYRRTTAELVGSNIVCRLLVAQAGALHGWSAAAPAVTASVAVWLAAAMRRLHLRAALRLLRQSSRRARRAMTAAHVDTDSCRRQGHEVHCIQGA
eukprot:4112547-Pleurochrysis_carterae.AAC.5